MARHLTLVRQPQKLPVVLTPEEVARLIEATPQGGPLSPLLSNLVLDEIDRAIDTENEADYLVEAYDAFLDIAEIKRADSGECGQ